MPVICCFITISAEWYVWFYYITHVIYIYLKGLIQFVWTKPSVCWTVAFTIPVNWDAIRPPVISAISFVVSGKVTLWHGQLKSLQMSICNWVLNCCYFCRISCTFLLIYANCVGNILMNISFWWQLFKRYSGTVKISWVNMFNKTYTDTHSCDKYQNCCIFTSSLLLCMDVLQTW